MKVKIRKRVLALVLAALFLSGSTASASSFDTTVYVGTNQNWSYSQWVTRTKKWSNCLARCYAVYPPNGGVDNFRYVQTAIFNSVGTQISNTHVLDEQATSSTPVFIYNGYLNLDTVYFKYRGNNPDYDAYCHVYGDGL